VRHPNEVLKEGEEVEAVILRSTPRARISLGMRQTQPDPGAPSPPSTRPAPRSRARSPASTDFGVFMKVEDGIEASSTSRSSPTSAW
jgi:small subunit ribosomal protein S1